MKGQNRSHLLAQNLNIEAAIGQSLVRLFEEEKEQLLEEIKENIRIKNSIITHLQAYNPNLVIFFTGATRTMLFNKKSPIEFSVLGKNQTDCDVGLNTEVALQTLEPIARHLKAKEDPFHDVFLCKKERFPVRRMYVLQILLIDLMTSNSDVKGFCVIAQPAFLARLVFHNNSPVLCGHTVAFDVIMHKVNFFLL